MPLLKGMRCPNPHCGSYGPFHIEVKLLVEVNDETYGLVNEERVRWEEQSFCRCVRCSHEGNVLEFTEESAIRFHNCWTCAHNDIDNCCAVVDARTAVTVGVNDWINRHLNYTTAMPKPDEPVPCPGWERKT